MATDVSYTKNGIKIDCNVSLFPAPRPQSAYPVPLFANAETSLISLSLYSITNQGAEGILVAPAGILPGSSSAVWTLFHQYYQGSPSTLPTPDAVPVTVVNGTFNALQFPNAMNAATHNFWLQSVDGTKTTIFPTSTISTPTDPTLGDILALGASGTLTPANAVLVAKDYAQIVQDVLALITQAQTLGLASSNWSTLGTAPPSALSGSTPSPTGHLGTLWTFLTGLPLTSSSNVTFTPATWQTDWGNVFTDINTLQTLIANTSGTINSSALGTNNLIPNWDSELGPVAGIAGNLIYDTTNQGYGGSRYVRAIGVGGVTYTSASYLLTGMLSVTPGDLYNFSGWFNSPTYPGPTIQIYPIFYNASGGTVSSSDNMTVWGANAPASGYTTGTWAQLVSYSFVWGTSPITNMTWIIPPGACFMQVVVYPQTGYLIKFDNLVLTKVAAPATTGTAGVVKPSANMAVASDGTLSVSVFTTSAAGLAPSTGGSSGRFLRDDGTWAAVSGAMGGTVTSVGLSMPSIFSVSGSPVTGTGTLSASLATQAANLVFAGPSSGSAAAPTFRSLVAADLPAPTWGSITGSSAQAAPSGGWTGTSTFSGPVYMPTGGGTNWFSAGTGDGASWSTYGSQLNIWNGLAIYNPTTGGSYPNQPTILFDSRNGAISLKGTFSGTSASFSSQVQATGFQFTSASSGTRGFVTSSSTWYTLGSSYGYGVSTNIAGGLDIMANQAGQDIRFYAGSANNAGSIPALVTFAASQATFSIPLLGTSMISASGTTAAYGVLRVNNPTTSGEASMSFSNNNSGPGTPGSNPGGNVWGVGLGVNGISPNWGIYNGGTASNALQILQSTNQAIFAAGIASNLYSTVANFRGAWTGTNYWGLGCVTSPNAHSIAFNMTDVNGNVLTDPGDMHLMLGTAEVYTTHNVVNNMNAMLAVTGMSNIPLVCTLATQPAWGALPPNSWLYVVDDTTAGSQGTLYHVNSSSTGYSSYQAGAFTTGLVQAGAVSAGALAASIGMISTLTSQTFTAGTTTSAPSGYKLVGPTLGYTAYCWNGDATGYYATSISNCHMEIGGDFSLNGYAVNSLVLGRLVNGGTVVWNTPGTHYWTCPPGITMVEFIGIGGGASGNSTNSTSTYSAGGSGAYFRCMCHVTQGTTYTIVVGAGGASVTANSSGNCGGDTTFNPDDGTIYCYGGGHYNTSSYAWAYGGGLNTPFTSILLGQFQTTSSSNTLVSSISGGYVLSACVGCAGPYANNLGGYNQIFTATSYAGVGAPSVFGAGGAATPGATAWGAGGGASSTNSASGVGRCGIVILRY